MPGLFEQSGSHSAKDIRWAPVFIEDLWPGLYTNRSALHDSSSLYERKYMGGRPGSMIGGLNTEVSIRNTVIRRYGISAFSTFVYPSAPDYAYAFELANGTIQVVVDTGSTGTLAITSAANASGGTTVYTGTFPNGGSNAYVGYQFTVAGFVTNLVNNGTFYVAASSTNNLDVGEHTRRRRNYSGNGNLNRRGLRRQPKRHGNLFIREEQGSRTDSFSRRCRYPLYGRRRGRS